MGRKAKNESMIIFVAPGGGTQCLFPVDKTHSALDKKIRTYVLTDQSVALVRCSHCGQPPGQLCRSNAGRLTLSTHCARRMAARYPASVLRAKRGVATAYRVVFVEVAS